jgi:hypothetical protein
MFSLTSSCRYYLYRHPTDMRKCFDGLCGIVWQEFGRLPLTGEVFIFLNRPKNRIKLLSWERGGFVLYYKRLEKGTFKPASCSSSKNASQIEWSELVLLIEGIETTVLKRRKRYERYS